MPRLSPLGRPAYVVAATALGAITLAGPAPAAAKAGPTQAAPAQESPAQAPAKRPHARRVTIHNADEWIAYLQAQPHIPPAETPQWNAVAQVMRDNAQSIH